MGKVRHPAIEVPVITHKAFMISLGILGFAFLWLVWALGHWGVEHVPPIGGGSYSLDKFVYSALIVLLAGIWSSFALLLALARRDPALSRRAYLLSAIGFVALVAACWMYGHNLS